MRKTWVLFVLITLVTSAMLFAPLAAQDRARIEVTPILGHSGAILSVAFSADGGRVLSSSSDGSCQKPPLPFYAATVTVPRSR
jgi:WD40 repeat protein